jgi:hypothetical protein
MKKNKLKIGYMQDGWIVTNKECVQPKDCEWFWSTKQKKNQNCLEEDFYIGQGVTRTGNFYGATPYTVIDIKGKVGSRIIKIANCTINEDKTGFDLGSETLFIKEKQLEQKLNKGNCYGVPYKINKKTNRLNKYYGHIWVGFREDSFPLEI